MDREIDRSVLRKRAARRWIVGAAGVALLATLLAYGASWFQPSVRRARIRTARVERGPLEATIQAAGVVVPATERVLSSPVEARIEAILKQPGELVRPGDPILKLDTSATRLQLDQLEDRLAQRTNDGREQALLLESRLADLTGRIETQRLDLELAEYQLQQVRKLSDGGLISEERLKQAEVTVRKATIALRQLDREVDTARRSHEARLEGIALETRILSKQHEDARRQLDLADTRSSEGGVLTWVADEVGTTVRRGDLLARIADLGSFRIEGTISDAYASRLEAGQRVRVLVGDSALDARLSTVLPTIEDGTLRFIVLLDRPSAPGLRHNLRVDVLVVTSHLEDVLRVRHGPFAQDAGLDQRVFVVRGDVAHRTDVRLGLRGRDYVEARSGLDENDEVIVSDMRDYEHAPQVRLK